MLMLIETIYAAIYIHTLTKSLEINHEVNEKRMHTVFPMTLCYGSNDLRAYRPITKSKNKNSAVNTIKHVKYYIYNVLQCIRKKTIWCLVYNGIGS